MDGDGKRAGESTEEMADEHLQHHGRRRQRRLQPGQQPGQQQHQPQQRRRGAISIKFWRKLMLMLRQSSRRLYAKISRHRSSVAVSLPGTHQVWVALVTSAASALLAHEIRLQRSLTAPPAVFYQATPFNHKLRAMLSDPPEKGVFSRNIIPSLFVGTRARLASAAAYAAPYFESVDDVVITLDGDGNLHSSVGSSATHPNPLLRFREKFRMGSDGTDIGVDWEVPPERYDSTLDPQKSPAKRRREVLSGPINRPVVLILHGINNDASFGYIRSLMRSCTERGWIAAGYNFRGCGGVPLRTPRGYTGGFTGDLRSTVKAIARRMVSEEVPLFLVGNSLGANLVTKYLGEEGRYGTLPKNIAGGISLANPLHIHSKNMQFPWNVLLGLGIKKMILLNWPSLSKMTCLHYRGAYRRALRAKTIGESDDIIAPFMVRNEPDHPFAARVGYEDGEAYWNDASSYRHVPHVSVPLMKVTAEDDFLVHGSSLRRMSNCLESPNVLVVKTKCGGHLGWQEVPQDAGSGAGRGWWGNRSWADRATADFIDAVIKLRDERRREQGKESEDAKMTRLVGEAKSEGSMIRSRL